MEERGRVGDYVRGQRPESFKMFKVAQGHHLMGKRNGPFPEAVAARRHFDSSLVRGIAWTGGVKSLSQVLSWISTFIVIRLLAPDDYGLVGIAMIYISFVTLVNEFGLGAAIIANRDLTTDHVSQINTLCLFIGGIAFLISCMAAVPLSMFFRTPELRWVVIVMSTAFLFSSLKTVPGALLEREMQYKTLALVEGLQSLTQTVTTVMLAALDFGYWALVFGGLVGMALSASVLLAVQPHAFKQPRPSEFATTLSFSWHILVSRVMWHLSSNMDFIVIGRVLGQTALGFYSVGWNISQAPLEKITSLVSRVSFPLFSNFQTDHSELRRYLLLMTEGISILTFPFAFGMAIIADEFVPVVMGDRWQEAVGPLSILAALTVVRSVVPLIPQVLVVTGGARFTMHNGIIVALLAPIFFYVGTFCGIIGVALAWWVLQPVTMVPIYRHAFRTIGLSMTSYISALWPAFVGSSGMIATVVVLRYVLPDVWPPVVSLAIHVLGGGVVYFVIAYGLYHDRFHGFVDLLRSARA